MKKCAFFASRLVFVFIFIFSLFLFSSCGQDESVPRIYLDDDFYWALTDAASEPEDAENLQFEHLDNMGYKNLMDLVGIEGKYIWLKAEFELIPELKNDDLSMVIPYLHYADILYLNGKYIDDYGVMGDSPDDPVNQEAGYVAHLFDFPELYLNQEGKNTILIKVQCLGHATITDGVFVGLRQDGWRTSDNMTFWRSRFYIFFEGVMLLCGLFFLMLYFIYKQEVSYRRFGLLNFFTALFFSVFFITDLPWAGFHGGVPFFYYVKFAKSICFFCMAFAFSMFICSFIEKKLNTFETAIQYLSFIVSTILVLLAPDYLWLVKKTLLLIPLSCLGLFISIGYAIAAIKKTESKQQTKVRFILGAVFFLIVVMGIDVIIKGAFRNIKLPFISIFGWTGVIIIIFIYFCIDYSKIANRLEYLNHSLEDEIKRQTKQLTDVNGRLEHDREKSLKDMRMAAIVQKKYFHAPEHPLKNWDFAVRYEPLSLVSGDLYNFYHEGEQLNGISLFDASGHGVAASLVTMLAENIIQQTYNELLQNGQSVAECLKLINERFIDAKGEIDNYLTGLLLNMKENEDGSCTVTMSNAGHPYPLFYNAKEDTLEEMLPTADMPYTGPVGLSGMNVDYSEMSFTMNSGDFLFLYTDGITEMQNREKLDFGIEAIMTILEKCKDDSAEDIAKKLMKGLENFIKDTPRIDDVSVIILKRV
ncbi:SpoIIE family protein phosphatase [Treponema bryantii]|uniref:SpoIIE family protein phosphatase n=1 Tax=Treponema bryantii TaxID=163 RepID=UPI0003B5BC64|nr:SpoIIE family protein phosphatase [Treponema bryantii]